MAKVLKLLTLLTILAATSVASATPEAAKRNVSPNAAAAFVSAVTAQDRADFLAAANSDKVHLVRVFTSGNLGGRGASLSDTVALASIDNNLAFAIAAQKPFSVPAIFPDIKSDDAMAQIPLLFAAEAPAFDQWGADLKRSLQGLTGIAEGAQAVLHHPGQGYWVLVDAQIIDDVLVGGFAVFQQQGEEVKLVALIELL